MKKVYLILTVIVAVIVVICAFNYKWIFYRFYPFDRITGEYEISVNDIDIDAINEYYQYENGGKIRLENDTETFKIKGGQYGRYKIGFMLDNDILYKLTNDEKFKEYENLDLSIVCFNTNWWHISELDIEIDIVKNNGEWYVCYNVELEEPLENFQITPSNVSKKIKLSEIDNAEILIGI